MVSRFRDTIFSILRQNIPDKATISGIKIGHCQSMEMTSQEVKAALEAAIVNLKEVDVVDTSALVEILELFLNLPDEPIEVRRSGASASEPAEFASDLTFQEWMKSPTSATDSRLAYQTLLANVHTALENLQFFEVLKKNELLENGIIDDD